MKKVIEGQELADLLNPTFSAATVCAVAGLNPVTLRAWRNRGHLNVSGSGEGWTRYSISEMAVVMAMKTMTDMGLAVDTAGEIASKLASAFDSLSRYPLKTAGWAMAAKIEGAWQVKIAVIQEDALQVAAEKLGWEASIVIDMRRVFARLQAGLAALREQGGSNG